MGIKITYKNLTPKQKAFICNGCGGKGGWIKPPAITIFDKPCGEHDFDYWLGCTAEDRKIADIGFYGRTKKAISKTQAKWYKKVYYHIWAYAYYKAVRFGGKKYFYYASKQKTWEDLSRELK